jgi:hypothetical protein
MLLVVGFHFRLREPMYRYQATSVRRPHPCRCWSLSIQESPVKPLR